MTLVELKQLFLDKLELLYDKEEASHIFMIYVEDKLNLDLSSQVEIELTTEILSDIEQLKKGSDIGNG